MNRFFKIGILILLCGCGFKPMYKKTLYNDLTKKTSEISIAPVKNFDGSRGIDLRNFLLEKLTPYGKAENPTYRLEITLSKPIEIDYTIKNDGIASSYLVMMEANFKLTEIKTSTILISRNIKSQLPYNILADQFSTEMLKNNAIKLIINNIAEQIYFAIITYFSEV